MNTNSLSTTLSKPTAGDYLSCLQVVMVNTTLPANIGSAARAMHTMGLSRLTVVDPKHPIDETSVSHAAGGSDVLADAQIKPTLEVAISDCQLVFAASSRSRHLPRPVVTPTQAAQIMLSFIDKQTAINQQPELNAVSQNQDSHTNNSHINSGSNKPNIAILFGREDRGLTNDELAYADYHIQIDANPEYPVLNVASAVQVIASFIFAYAQTHQPSSTNHHALGTPTQINNLDNNVLDKSNLDKSNLDKSNLDNSDLDNSDLDNSDLDNSDLSQIAVSPIINTYVRQQWDEPAITQQQLQQLTQRTTELMVQRGLADADHLKSLPSRLSRLGSRIQLDQKEFQMLSALIAKLSKD
ncbi:TrmH family RNA methyltransferase [Psychrobacter sp. CAL346-MNA-CIBAN-0220]|uniref:TrmH family RNA methyltransferase n=1 Tax=Psychrobacter sp. CAL346-MNA-CIBAN-0220 TaxID=3140457 RepID=UPI003319A8E8